MPRIDGRAHDEMRQVCIIPGFQSFAEGSALIEVGLTRVICSVSIENSVPHFLKGHGKGWITAEYGMLPRSTLTRSQREATQGRIGGRTHEIQRLIGRSLRAVTQLDVLGERTCFIDCDVVQADGGTRTAAITGSFIALYLAFKKLVKQGTIASMPINSQVAATSVGIVHGVHLLDLCYAEDSKAEIDCNVVMNSYGKFIEIQGTAEGSPFTRGDLDSLLNLAGKGMKKLFEIQSGIIESIK